MPLWASPVAFGACLAIAGWFAKRVVESLDKLSDRLGDLAEVVAAHEPRISRLEKEIDR